MLGLNLSCNFSKSNKKSYSRLCVLIWGLWFYQTKIKKFFVAVFLRIYNHKNIAQHMASSTIPPKFITYIPPPHSNTYNHFYLCYYYVILCIQPKTCTLETVSKSILVVLRGNYGSVDKNIRFAYLLLSHILSNIYHPN